MKSLIATAFLILTITISAQNYKQISILISSANDFITLAQIGIDLEDSKFSKDNKLTLFVSDEEFDLISSNGFSYTILIDDWNSYYKSLQQLSNEEKNNYLNESLQDYNVDGFGYGTMGGYYTYSEIVANLDSMYAQYPNLITQKYSIGSSQQSRIMWAVKISDNPNINENEPAVGDVYKRQGYAVCDEILKNIL